MSGGNDREFIDYLQEKEGGKAMKCPLLKKRFDAEQGINYDEPLDCLQEECAWWDEDFDQCVVKSLAFNLWAIRGELSDLRAKIPHSGQFLQKP